MSILAQLNRPTCEGNKKIVQMKSILHVLFHGCPMLKYENLYELFRSLGVSNNLSACIGFILLVGSLLSSCTCKFKTPLSRPFNRLDS